MSEPSAPKLARWPFYLGDALLLGVSVFVVWQGTRPLSAFDAGCLCACVALGAFMGALPHLLEFRASSRAAEAAHLDHAVLQVQNIQIIARQITSATAGWQAIQDDAAGAVQAAREIADRLATETRAFQDFLARANDTEKNHLRLEVEKLRRAETDWLQVLTRILDHTYALHQAAARAGQPAVSEQIGGFQKACRDIARRVGLTPFTPRPGDPFDVQQHQLADADGPTPKDGIIADVLATGYRYQGLVVRLPLVVLKGARTEPSDLSLRMINQRREQEGAPRPGPETSPSPESAGPVPEVASPVAGAVPATEAPAGEPTTPDSGPPAAEQEPLPL